MRIAAKHNAFSAIEKYFDDFFLRRYR